MSESISQYLNPGRNHQVDPMFPLAPDDWTSAVAERIASEEGLTLNEDHWEVIRSLQEFYSKHQTAHVRELHDALEEKFHAKGGVRYLYAVFPKGPVAQGCRLAGLNPPAGSTDTSFGSVQ